MIRSLRAQLALWHGALLVITLIVVAGLTYLLLRHALSSLADSALHDVAEKTAKNIASLLYKERISSPTATQREEERRRLEQEFIDASTWGRFVQVDDGNGFPVAFSDALRTRHFRDDETIRRLMLERKSRVHFYTDFINEAYPMRIVAVPVEMGEEVPYLVRVGAPVEGVEEAILRVSALLIVLTPCVFLIALAGGWFLVGRALQPVDEMTRTALTIEGKRLDKRISPSRSDNEIGRLAGAFNEMIERLDASFRQIQRFTADASHELKTPLTAIKGEAEVALLAERSPNEYRKTLQSIVEETDRLTEIVNNLLLLSQADAEQVQMKRDKVALDRVVLEAFEQMEPLARTKNINIDIEALDEVEVLGDALWLKQMLTNLLNNAIKYTPEGGKVVLRLTQSENIAELVVSDTGSGIPEEHLPRLFDRFYRVDYGRSRDQGGSGLGLNIVKWIVDSHEGEIRVRSEVGKGTAFSVLLRSNKGAEETALGLQ